VRSFGEFEGDTGTCVGRHPDSNVGVRSAHKRWPPDAIYAGRTSEYVTWDREFDDSRQKHPKACLDGAGLLDDDQLRSLIGGAGGFSWIHLGELEVERDCRDQELGSLGLAIA
jgi:hypothetical protein